MGESKRRKQILGDRYGQPKKLTFKGRELRLIKYWGELMIEPDTGTGAIRYEEDYTEDELNILVDILDGLLPHFIPRYPTGCTEFLFSCDFKDIDTKEQGLIEFYPKFYDDLKGIELTKVYAQMNATKIYHAVTEEEGESSTPVIPHKSPREHTRKSHTRMVRYGKGRKLVKKVEIKETVVNAGRD